MLIAIRAPSLARRAARLLRRAPAARAAVGGLPSNIGHADSRPSGSAARQAVRRASIDAGSGRVQLVAPLRAAYGASVPVKIVSKLPQTAALYVRALYLLVDKNPSPLAAVLDLTPEVGQADFETRLRVDEYSHVRVVSELSNGELHTDSRYVKTSGGCSAPPNRDALHLIGKTIFKLPDGAEDRRADPGRRDRGAPERHRLRAEQRDGDVHPAALRALDRGELCAAARSSTPSWISRSARTRRCASTSCRTAPGELRAEVDGLEGRRHVRRLAVQLG